MLFLDVDYIAVSALALAAVQCLVYHRKQLVIIGAVVRECGTAYRSGNEQTARCEMIASAKYRAVVVQCGEKRFFVIIFKMHEINKKELITAETSADTEPVDIFRKRCRNTAENIVSGAVSVCIVHELEIIKIKHHEAERDIVGNKRSCKAEDIRSRNKPGERIRDMLKSRSPEHIGKIMIFYELFDLIHCS